jgi:hypothetical protein
VLARTLLAQDVGRAADRLLDACATARIYNQAAATPGRRKRGIRQLNPEFDWFSPLWMYR